MVISFFQAIPEIQMMLSIFILMGIGLSSPYLILFIFPKFLKFLPKPGIWMKYTKYFLGFLLLLSSIWIGSILGIPIRIFYTFLIYFISLYGLFTMIKAKKLNRYAFFWMISGFYFYLVLGWMGFTRYFSSALIYISLFFANGMNQIIFNKKKL